MADAENRRKCFKCGSSFALDNVKLFRFPKPAKRNLLRCELWTQYIFPEKDYSSTELQTKLHTEHRMLCQKHFRDEDFTDDSKTKLVRTAVPSDTIAELPTMASTMEYIIEPQPGPSYRATLCDITNLQELSSTTVQSKPGTAKKTEEKVDILRAKCTKYVKKNCLLNKRIQTLKSKNMLIAIEEDKNVVKLSTHIAPAFALLLQGQMLNQKRKKQGRRWSKEEKIIALRIYKRSPTCYRLLQRLFPLPSPSTLKTLLNKISFNVGVNPHVFQVLKKFVQTQEPSENSYTLMFDEMSIKKHMFYNSKADIIEGFQDHSTHGRSPTVAGYALVFMIAGVRRKLKQPIAHYFSSGFSTADRLAVLIKEVLHQCFQIGLNIVAIVCDMDGVNRRALSILGASSDHPQITVEDNEIVTMFDTPHLLKCFRNLFMKYNIECTTNITSGDKMGIGVAKWEHIKQLYELDNENLNFVFAPCLKKEHLNPNSKQKMKIILAAQVLSHSVAAGLLCKTANGSLTPDAVVTANVVSKMDQLFDSLNSDSSNLKGGKPEATNMTTTSPHFKIFREMKTFFERMKYIGSPRKPPSQDGWIWTINGVERLFRNSVQKHKIKSLATRRLQQDPLENLFGCIRGNCGSNTNPTCGQFVAGLKTAILSNLSHLGKGGNCENDSNTLINNFTTFLSSPNVPLTRVDAHEIGNTTINELLPIEIDEALNEATEEIQACAYVCGFLIKKFQLQCEKCRTTLLSEAAEKCHMFVECKEYREFKKSLHYASRDFIACVEYCAHIINIFLKEKAHIPELRQVIIQNIKENVNFDFLQCDIHKQENVDKIALSVFIICVKRFCILENRKFSKESSAIALKRKMNIILHK